MPVQSVDVLQIRAHLKKNLSEMPLERLREFRTRLDRLEEFEASRRTIEALPAPLSEDRDGNDVRVFAVAICLMAAYARENDVFGQAVGAMRGDPEIQMPRLDVESRLYKGIKRHWYDVFFLARMECINRKPENYTALKACISEQTAGQY
jgi:hypothetical protein